MKLRAKSPVLTGLFLFSVAFLSGCPSSSTKLSTAPVAQVNDHRLSTRELALRLARRLKNLDAFSAKNPLIIQNAKDEILKDFIIQSLIIDWARSHDIKVSDSDVDKEVEKIRAGYPDDLAFRRSLADENMSFSEWRESLRYTLIQRAFFEQLRAKLPTPTEAEIKKYFEENRSQFRKRERVFIRQIVSDEESKAELLRTEAKNKDFANLAQKYSIAPERKSGGAVGWVEKGNVDFFDPVFSQPVGALSQIIKSPFGFHIVKVEKKLPASAGSLDEARPEIVRHLMAQREQGAFVSWLDGQIRSSRVLKDYQLLQSIQVETRSSND
ncbi:MAG: peptidyl-prolyl cis-trans isomerase [Bdellovibrionaceae bacterium]|nr:peptidyl-prolyl cis-trans isomerase [Pseudobdellovibrionaceae bacterium]